MNEKLIDVLKYFLLTSFSLELMYYIAKSKFNLGLVLIVSLVFTALYAMDKFKVFSLLFSPRQSNDTNGIKKNQAL